MATTPSAEEQLFLELINSARLDPLGDASRYIVTYSDPLLGATNLIDIALHFDFGVQDGVTVDGAELLEQLSALVPVQPVAWNPLLTDAARLHNDKMIEANVQSHQVTSLGEGDLGQRVGTDGGAGYNYQMLGENIFAFTHDPLHGHAGFMVDWGEDDPAEDDDGVADGMQDPAGHRLNIMDPDFREVGIGVTLHAGGSEEDVGPLVVTQDFGVRQSSPGVFILGVAFNDNQDPNHPDNDNFYSLTEGVAELNVSLLGGGSVESFDSGGYALEVDLLGERFIRLSGAGLSGDVDFKTFLTGGQNIKLDVIDGNTLHTSASGTITGSAITTVRGLGTIGLALTTGSGAQTIEGSKGNDTLNGGSGNDKLSGGLGSDTASYAGATKVTVNLTKTKQNTGGGGTDTLSSIENVTGSSFGDTLTGNSGANILNGGAGNDKLNGGSGSDTASYAGATKAVKVNLAVTTAQNTGGAGSDTLTSIEKLTGSDFNDTLTGNTAANTLNGGIGNDTLNGAGGSDTMAGGAGNDTYTVGSAGDQVIESSGSGTDTVKSALSYTLADNFENLILTGTGNTNGHGNSANNTITGNAGKNTLDGKGGADTMTGGAGDDTLVWEAADTKADGGTGNADTLKLGAGNDDIDLVALSGGKLKGLERIDLRTGDHEITLDADAVLDLSSSSNELRVLGDSGDTAHIGPGWTQGANKTISGITYESYSDGLAKLLVQEEITVTMV